jgi:predicted nucleic acid-binding protein
MTKIVVDASVAIKWYVPEIHSAAAVRLLDSDFILLAPDLIGAELANAVWKKVRRAEISRQEGNEILAAFDKLQIELGPTRPLLAAAFEAAVALDRTVYDCLYLALAVAQNCSFFTADRKFHSAVLPSSSLAAHIRWIEDAP